TDDIVGILGNFSVLYHELFLYYIGCRFRSTDLILKHLTVANLLVSKGIPQTTAALRLKDFLNDFGGKLVFYVYRVSRDVSTGTTCLLSVFQAITTSPRHSRWMEFKVKAQKYLCREPFESSLVLTLWASCSMVFILHRHKQRVQHIHKTTTSSQPSPKSRATHSIHLLVSTFVHCLLFHLFSYL
ncbi:LOW QUALITY PROTEIN: vomeronasal type-1 receptor 4-like, partial [Hipposideros larvatus]